MIEKTILISLLRVRIVLALAFSCMLVAAAFAQEQPADGESAPEAGQGGMPPALVAVAPSVMQQLQDRFVVVGRLREVRRSVVATEQAGRILSFNIDEGDLVIAGQTVLAPIDDVFVTLEVQAHVARVQAAKARVDAAKATLEQANRDYKYLRELEAKRSAKPKEVEDAETRVKANEAQLKAEVANVALAEAGLADARKRLERSIVYAPFDGVVVKKLTEMGQWVNVGDGIVEIISRGEIDAVIDVPESMINQLKIGVPVDIEITPLKQTITGHVNSINPSGMTAARTFPVKVRLDDMQGQLKAGMSINALVPLTNIIDVITVPRDAISYTTSGTVVWAALEGQAFKMPVKVLFQHDGLVAVKPLDNPMGPPLSAGMPVVIEGAERLMMPGQPVNIANPQVLQGNALGS